MGTTSATNVWKRAYAQAQRRDARRQEQASLLVAKPMPLGRASRIDGRVWKM